jgi:hypothetical protein
MKKSSNKSFNYLVWTTLNSRVNIEIHFVSSRCKQSVLSFATSGVDISGKFTAGVVAAGGNLPPISLIKVVHLTWYVSPQNF